MNSSEETIQTSPFLLVDFYAEWCEPCKWLNPILKDVTESFKERLQILKIDVDTELLLASEHEVKSIPTLILFKKGAPVWRMAGFKVAEELITIVKSHL